ncbi:MAG: hypothetical protein WC322_07055 [Candidatus Paceibacterota bacterium]|jgi:hypothetical protein
MRFLIKMCVLLVIPAGFAAELGAVFGLIPGFQASWGLATSLSACFVLSNM